MNLSTKKALIKLKSIPNKRLLLRDNIFNYYPEIFYITPDKKHFTKLLTILISSIISNLSVYCFYF